MQPVISITLTRCHPHGVVAEVCARVTSIFSCSHQDARRTALGLERRTFTVGVSLAQPTRLYRGLNPTAARTLVIALQQSVGSRAAEIIR